MQKSPYLWNNLEEKQHRYQEAINLPFPEFWAKEAKALHWQKDFSETFRGGFDKNQWFLGGELNASYNCLDRHIVAGAKDRQAIIFEDENQEVKSLSFFELKRLSCQIATHLQARGIKAGDRVAIYMPLRPEAIASMLACARIGAIHTVVFAGFAKEALVERIEDAQAKAIICAPSTLRKGSKINLSKIVGEALKDHKSKSIHTVLSFYEPHINDEREIVFSNKIEIPDNIENPPSFSSDHPLFILYTSGTTGKPKGIFHKTGGYLTQVTSTTKWIFDLRENDLFWCTADVGWITGHSYLCYGPLSLGQTIFLYEGALNFPSSARVYDLIERHKISVLYTAPTAIRMFMAAGESFKQGKNLNSLRLLGSVGEPINPEAWRWYKKVFGDNKLDIVDTWWQTETGAIMLSAIPGIHKAKAGSASKSFIGLQIDIVESNGQRCQTNENGFLVIKQPWPSLAGGIWGDQQRFYDTYFSQLEGCYFAGDGAHKDHEGDFFINGRIDDVVNISGHRLGTAEVESALVAHQSVAEAGVVGVADDITGQRLEAFVMLVKYAIPSDELKNELIEQVKAQIGAFAKPAKIAFVDSLPKTRSGKIMRRLLRSLAEGVAPQTDTSTLENENWHKSL